MNSKKAMTIQGYKLYMDEGCGDSYYLDEVGDLCPFQEKFKDQAMFKIYELAREALRKAARVDDKFVLNNEVLAVLLTNCPAPGQELICSLCTSKECNSCAIKHSDKQHICFNLHGRYEAAPYEITLQLSESIVGFLNSLEWELDDDLSQRECLILLRGIQKRWIKEKDSKDIEALKELSEEENKGLAGLARSLSKGDKEYFGDIVLYLKKLFVDKYPLTRNYFRGWGPSDSEEEENEIFEHFKKVVELGSEVDLHGLMQEIRDSIAPKKIDLFNLVDMTKNVLESGDEEDLKSLLENIQEFAMERIESVE